MDQSCNYCHKLAEKLTIVVAVERNSGPPFILWACDACMKSRGLKEVAQ